MVTTILDKMLQPATDQMPPEFARTLLELRASDDLQARIEELRGKANSGQISGDEELEYRSLSKRWTLFRCCKLRRGRFSQPNSRHECGDSTAGTGAR